MNFVKTSIAATAIAALSTSAFAGGLAPEIMETPVMEEEVMAAPAGSISPTIIVMGILGGLLIASMVGTDDEPEEGDREGDPEDDECDVFLCELDPEVTFPDGGLDLN